MDKLRRGKKANIDQMEVLTNFVCNNRIMIRGKSLPSDILNVEQKWAEVAELLNNVENGSRKDIKQWRNFYAQWKSSVRKKARQNKNGLSITSNGGYVCRILSDLENRLMNVVGWVSVAGSSDMPEELNPSSPTDPEIITIEIEPLELPQNPNEEVPILGVEYNDEVMNLNHSENENGVSNEFTKIQENPLKRKGSFSTQRKLAFKANENYAELVETKTQFINFQKEILRKEAVDKHDFLQFQKKILGEKHALEMEILRVELQIKQKKMAQLLQSSVGDGKQLLVNPCVDGINLDDSAKQNIELVLMHEELDIKIEAEELTSEEN